MPSGSAILVLLSRELDMFSAMHRLPKDEMWHFYLGDQVELTLLGPSGGYRTEVLGPDLLAGQRVQYLVPSGTWMGARVHGGGRWALLGCTMSPGFVPTDYEGGDPDDLAAAYPDAAEAIRALCRPGAPLRHPVDRDHPDTSPPTTDRSTGAHTGRS